MGMIGRGATLCVLTIGMAIGLPARAQNDIEDPNTFPDAWYRIAFDSDGNYIHGDGDGYAAGTWYYYPDSGQWRQWFYNEPYDPNRQGLLEYHVYIKAVDPNLPTYAQVSFNWSTPAWSALSRRRPPLPSDAATAELEDRYMDGRHLRTVENWIIGTVEPIGSHLVAAYNPEWVSIDIRGHNAYVYRGAFHSCFPKDPFMGACYNSDTGDCYTTYHSRCAAPYVWLEAGSSCAEFLRPKVFPVPVYRFWSVVRGAHFFTAREREKDELIAQQDGVWFHEGVAYYALVDAGDPNSAPVYRFWSDSLGVQFYTIRESEKDKLINNYVDAWTYEGVAFYAYPEGREPMDTQPVYRFWSGTQGYHFYTIREAEKDKLIANYADIWTFEGIAWYAYAP